MGHSIFWEKHDRMSDELVLGEVAEWSKAPVSKTGKGESSSWVQIPPSPPFLFLIKPSID